MMNEILIYILVIVGIIFPFFLIIKQIYKIRNLIDEHIVRINVYTDKLIANELMHKFDYEYECNGDWIKFCMIFMFDNTFLDGLNSMLEFEHLFRIVFFKTN